MRNDLISLMMVVVKSDAAQPLTAYGPFVPAISRSAPDSPHFRAYDRLTAFTARKVRSA